jgi:hypothetical protein
MVLNTVITIVNYDQHMFIVQATGPCFFASTISAEKKFYEWIVLGKTFQAKAPSYTTHLQIQVLAEKSFQDKHTSLLVSGKEKKKLYEIGTKLDMFLELNFIISLLKFDAFRHQVYCSTDSYDSAITFSITTLAILTPSMPIKRLHSLKYIMLC